MNGLNRHRKLVLLRGALAFLAAGSSACTSRGMMGRAEEEDRAAVAAAEDRGPAGASMAAADGLQFTPEDQPAISPSPAPPPASAPTDRPRPGRQAEAPQAPGATERDEPFADVLLDLFPHIRVNRAQRLVEFDGFVPIDAHHPESPLVFLEVVACTRGTKEHEALVATDAKPSEVHAALLLIGLEPGEPGSFRWEDETLVPIPPSGDPVRVSIAYRNDEGLEVESEAATWIKHAETGMLISAAGAEAPGWVFAGSAFVTKGGREMYDADGAGTLVGLATFGSETVAFMQMISPEAAVQEPVWVAAGGTVPSFDTPVVVRLRAAETEAEPDAAREAQP